MKILVLNAGSSSLRLQLIESKGWKQLFKGHVDGIGLKTCKLRGDIEHKINAKNHTEALKIALTALKEIGIIKTFTEIDAIGHRVVHGGEKYHAPTKINRTVLKDLKKLIPLAPLHNPANIEGIKACMKILKKAPNIAIFDTGFHATLPKHAYLYGLPYNLYRKHGIRKYGFHGTSHKYVSLEAKKWLTKNKKKSQRIITCHMGNGVSLTAIKNGKSIDTSMGFTPLEGVIMGTRSGSFDPSILLYLLKNTKTTPEKLDTLINKESGLKGLTNISSDVRPLWKIYQNPKHRHYKKVKQAFDIYSYHIAQTIGAYATTLNGLDALVFTAGIGENGWYLRRDICKHLSYLGIELDQKKNQTTINRNTGSIQKNRKPVQVLVIPTNEELQIAKETSQFLK
jgi:acetate kinase